MKSTENLGLTGIEGGRSLNPSPLKSHPGLGTLAFPIPMAAPMYDEHDQKRLIGKERQRLREAYKHRAPAPEKGHVEIFMIHDEGYHAIYLDGQHVDDTANKYAPINTYPLSRAWRQDIAAQAGVAEEDLRFSYSVPCFVAFEQGVETEDMTYDMMVQWRGEHPDPFDFHAIDLGSLEEKVLSGVF